MMKRTCLRCGSDKIIPNVPLSDKYGDFGGRSGALEVQVHGNPSAWLFKDTAAGEIVAFICGSCGHTELKAHAFPILYRKYQESLRAAEPAQRGPQSGESQGGEMGELVVCLSCGQSLPNDSSRCPSCGWTWEEGQEGQAR